MGNHFLFFSSAPPLCTQEISRVLSALTQPHLSTNRSMNHSTASNRKLRLPTRWVQIFIVSVCSRKMLPKHLRKELSGGLWPCFRYSLSFIQSGNASNDTTLHDFVFSHTWWTSSLADSEASAASSLTSSITDDSLLPEPSFSGRTRFRTPSVSAITAPRESNRSHTFRTKKKGHCSAKLVAIERIAGRAVRTRTTELPRSSKANRNTKKHLSKFRKAQSKAHFQEYLCNFCQPSNKRVKFVVWKTVCHRESQVYVWRWVQSGTVTFDQENTRLAKGSLSPTRQAQVARSPRHHSDPLVDGHVLETTLITRRCRSTPAVRVLLGCTEWVHSNLSSRSAAL